LPEAADEPAVAGGGRLLRSADAGLLVRANWLQYVDAEELAPDKNNRRVQIDRFASPRGDIIATRSAHRT
jgi:hypothetical protein